MKRFLLTGVLFLSVGQFLAHAQNNSRTTYTDDIYYGADDAKKNAEKEAEAEEARRAKAAEAAAARNENTYTSSGDDAVADGNYESYNRSYESDGDEYIDYNDDDYYYSSRMRRFNSNYYGFGYYTPFYDPFWYDPWYSPWYGPRSGVSVSIGWGGPYWSSYYGMSGWYGYPGFYSAWNYPYYAGWGGYYGGWGGYYGGYYDGYYAGAYGGNVRSVQYGPRTSFNGPRNGYRRDAYSGGGGSLRSSTSGAGPRQVLRTAPDQHGATDNYRGRATNNGDLRNADRSVSSPDRSFSGNDMRMRNRFDNNAGSNDNRGAEQQQIQAAPQPRAERRGRFFQNLNNAFSNDNSGQRAQPASEQRARQQMQSEQPAQRYEPAQQRQAEPSYQRSTPSSSPSRGGSMGGGSNGGGGRRR